MKKLTLAVLLISGITIGCGGNKRLVSKRASKAVARNEYPGPRASTISDSLEAKNDLNGKSKDEEAETNKRVRVPFQGSSGIGTGSSYAASSYGSESYKSKDKVTKEESDNLLNEEMVSDEPWQSDTTSENTIYEEEWASDSIGQEVLNSDESPSAENMEEEYSW